MFFCALFSFCFVTFLSSSFPSSFQGSIMMTFSMCCYCFNAVLTAEGFERKCLDGDKWHGEFSCAISPVMTHTAQRVLAGRTSPKSRDGIPFAINQRQLKRSRSERWDTTPSRRRRAVLSPTNRNNFHGSFSLFLFSPLSISLRSSTGISLGRSLKLLIWKIKIIVK